MSRAHCGILQFHAVIQELVSLMLEHIFIVEHVMDLLFLISLHVFKLMIHFERLLEDGAGEHRRSVVELMIGLKMFDLRLPGGPRRSDQPLQVRSRRVQRLV